MTMRNGTRWLVLAVTTIGAVGIVLTWRGLVRESRIQSYEGVLGAGDRSEIAGLSWDDQADLEAEEPQRALLDTGQEIVGDFRILSFDEVLRENGAVAAMKLAIEKYPEKLEEFLRTGLFDANMRLVRKSGNWEMPIVKAMRQGTAETFEILMAAGADPGLLDSSGRNALHEAAYRGLMGAIDIFLESGADPSNVDYDGSTPLRMAASAGRMDVVERLLRAGADPEHSALWAAAGGGHDRVVRRLVAAGAAPGGSSRQNPPGIHCPMWQAAMGGRLSTVRLLLELGAPPGCDGVSQPIDAARRAGHSEIVDSLLAASK